MPSPGAVKSFFHFPLILYTFMCMKMKNNRVNLYLSNLTTRSIFLSMTHISLSSFPSLEKIDCACIGILRSSDFALRPRKLVADSQPIPIIISTLERNKSIAFQCPNSSPSKDFKFLILKKEP